jgi:putative heme transporter
MIRARLRRRKGDEGRGGEEGRGAGEDEFVEIDTAELSDAFAAPRWLRDVGLTAWLLVGVTLFLVGAVWILSLTHTIVLPVIAAGVVAAVASPLVAMAARRGAPRAVGALLVMLGIVALGVGVFVVIVGGIVSQSGDIADQLSGAKDTLAGWLEDVGVDPSHADRAKQDASTATSDTFQSLLQGVAKGISGLTSIVFFLSLTALSLFFLLKDGPVIRAWGERHLGVPVPVARVVSSRVLASLRGYFFGVTLVAAFNAVVVGVGALVLGVPLAGTIAAVTFVGAYIPYLGAWSAGAFAVMIALGGAGTEAAIGMAVLQLLANGVLQQLVQPFAYGAALGIHPLAVLVVTIAGGALFGAVGLILAAPLTAAATAIAADLSRARAEEEAGPAPEAGQVAGEPAT